MTIEIPASRGRSGRPWQRLRTRVLSTSGVCILCGHDGSQDVDHIIPRSVAPELAEDITNLGPIHGVDGCPSCLRKCNQEKRDRPLDQALVLKTSRDWYASPTE